MTSDLQRKWARTILAASLALCWVDQRGLAAGGPPSGPLIELGRHFLLSPFIACVLVVAWLLIALSSSLWGYGAAAACALIANWTLISMVHDGMDHSALMPEALCVVLFIALISRRGDAGAEAEAWELGCALIGAMYFLSGVEKLRETGFSWAHGETLRALIASESINANGWVRTLRWSLASSHLFGTCGATYALAVELIGGPAFVSRRLRPWAGASIFFMHVGIAITAGIGWHLFPAIVAVLSF